MDFYLAKQRLLTDLAVNAKSCLNSNFSQHNVHKKCKIILIFGGKYEILLVYSDALVVMHRKGYNS